MRRAYLFVAVALILIGCFWLAGIVFTTQGVPKPSSSPIQKTKRAEQAAEQDNEPQEAPKGGAEERERTCFNTNTLEVIADNKGYVCPTSDVSPVTRCCMLNRPHARRFDCNNCSNGCCEKYEICVSCCMGNEHGDKNNFHHCASRCHGLGKKQALPFCFKRLPPRINTEQKGDTPKVEWLVLSRLK